MSEDHVSAEASAAAAAAPAHPLGDLVENHFAVLASVNVLAAVSGLQIALNMLWHLRVANANSGRGVLRIIR